MSDAAEWFERERERLLAIAYGLLGSHSEAQDVVQEAWLRWSASSGVERPEAWLTTVVSRLALDQLRSARVRRERYTGPWLPEPVSRLPNPEQREQVRSLLSLGFLHLLERLNPEERVVLVLREAFDCSYEEIAQVLGKSEPATRQMLSRAKRRVQQERADQWKPVPRGIVERFLEALYAGDQQAVLEMLAPDAVLYGDGGGRVPSAINPIVGADRIVRFLFGLARKYQREGRVEEFNGAPGLLVRTAGRLGVMAFVWNGERVVGLRAVNNPDKLAAIEVRAAFPPA